MTEQRYWAAEQGERLTKAALDRVATWRRWYYQCGHAEKARKGWRYAHGWTDAGENSSRLQAGGESQALVKAVVNGVRPLRQRTMAMVLSGAPEMQPVASNSDAASRESADLGKGVLEDLHYKKRRKARDRRVLAFALDMGEGYLVVEWDAKAGDVVATKPDTDAQGQFILDDQEKPVPVPAVWEGDLDYWEATAFDVARDPGLCSPDDMAWVVVRRWVPRWRLVARYPEQREKILGVSNGSSVEDEHDWLDVRARDATIETDMVALYTLWHLDRPELPGGLEARFLADGTPLGPVGEYPYGDKLPVHGLMPDETTRTTLGYSTMWDALGLSDLINAIISGCATNVVKGAVPLIFNPAGSGASKGVPLGTGHKVVNIANPELAPFFMDSPQTPPEAYKLLEVLERMRMEAQGLNETAMGRPPYSGMAAQAMALLDAKADEYQDALREGYRHYLSSVATFEMELLKRFAHEERVAQVVGKAKRWMARKYTGTELQGVGEVRVEPVGAASRTLAGRLGMLETLNAFNVPLSPEQVVELTQTGQYEADFEAPLANRMRIREESEALLSGEMPHAPLMTDPHWQDIPEHLALLSSPAARQSPDVVGRVLEAVQAHLDLWRNMPSDLLALLGGPPPPPPGVPAGMVPPMPGAAASGAPPPLAPPGAGGPAAAALQPGAEPEAPDMPVPPEAA